MKKNALMEFTKQLLSAAVGLWLFAEGITFFLGAERLKPVLRALAETRTAHLRITGLVMMLLGVGAVALARYYFISG
ncbi:Protein of unknown function DUF2065 [Oleidesulfovibrio alaskensis G20]|jgi:uncharacterized protein YjeT (DUF2065 family)|uniref:DUF2065 domain-containing protein n=1 Tax=Oleidesulfovibrio alaskensis (strain ATCC BAA-1058 / DSM 17464 / G20) TaxID=207559 RepID=Q30WG6_OLEA2|nr:DUF2065 domain-containing protein [Oleidesulfovibrio alaskensis]ABB39980.1 Protein of unknown function DUF2065 [Oleidesulfovibrio alaskensis G20]MBG0773338.1 DUF2065 domain-containing protein [Oleidesulfovibrio alaskensis]MBL3581497.1 DUF2065 domain-containing protein [Oleidesulfovibrio alaskensis]